jgi:hypothetical protein
MILLRILRRAGYLLGLLPPDRAVVRISLVIVAGSEKGIQACLFALLTLLILPLVPLKYILKAQDRL